MEDLKKYTGWFLLVALGVAAKIALQERKLQGLAIIRFFVLGIASAFVMEGLILTFLPMPRLTHDAVIVLAALAGAEIMEGLYTRIKRDGLQAVVSETIFRRNGK